jgi:hypothetical protein
LRPFPQRLTQVKIGSGLGLQNKKGDDMKLTTKQMVERAHTDGGQKLLNSI